MHLLNYIIALLFIIIYLYLWMTGAGRDGLGAHLPLSGKYGADGFAGVFGCPFVAKLHPRAFLKNLADASTTTHDLHNGLAKLSRLRA